MRAADKATRPPRIDRDDREMIAPNGATYWRLTTYKSLELEVMTLWRARTMPPCAYSVVEESWSLIANALYRKDYDPMRVTRGGLAEAHEAVCARVERGELP